MLMRVRGKLNLLALLFGDLLHCLAAYYLHWVVNRLVVNQSVTEIKDLIDEINRTAGEKQIEEKLKSFKSRFKG